ncbi:hypothetical protein Sste5344_008717 [Sporothrix stenoceras]
MYHVLRYQAEYRKTQGLIDRGVYGDEESGMERVGNMELELDNKDLSKKEEDSEDNEEGGAPLDRSLSGSDNDHNDHNDHDSDHQNDFHNHRKHNRNDSGYDTLHNTPPPASPSNTSRKRSRGDLENEIKEEIKQLEESKKKKKQEILLFRKIRERNIIMDDEEDDEEAQADDEEDDEEAQADDEDEEEDEDDEDAMPIKRHTGRKHAPPVSLPIREFETVDQDEPIESVEFVEPEQRIEPVQADEPVEPVEPPKNKVYIPATRDWTDDWTVPPAPAPSPILRAVELPASSLPALPTTLLTANMVARDRSSPDDKEDGRIALAKQAAAILKCEWDHNQHDDWAPYQQILPLYPDVDTTEETVWMSTCFVPERNNTPLHPEAYRNHPHTIDRAASGGNHLMVVERLWNDAKDDYKGKPRAYQRNQPNQPRPSPPFKWADPLSAEEEKALDMASIGLIRRGRQLTSQKEAYLNMRGIEFNEKLTVDIQMSKPYLSYYDVTLYHEDVHVLRNDWLTDNNITFWEEYLEHEVLPKYPQARIVLLRATMSVMLMNSRIEDARSALPRFDQTTHIFLPISDAAIRNMGTAEAGSHWSLLLISITDGVAFHYDSMGGCNTHAARNVATRMAAVLNTPLRFRDIEDTPQQANNIDCGVFVCVLMRFLLVKRLLNAHAREKVSMSLGGKMIDAQGGRQEMLRIIENLRREAERRRSASPMHFSKKETPRIS